MKRLLPFFLKDRQHNFLRKLKSPDEAKQHHNTDAEGNPKEATKNAQQGEKNGVAT